MYCTLQDLLLGIPAGRLAAYVNDEDRPQKDEDNPDGWDFNQTDDPVTLRVSHYINIATDEINGYLAAKFVTPINPVPSRIIEIASVIVKYKLHMRRDVPTDESPAAAEYKRIIRELEDIRDGDIVITGMTQQSKGGFVCNKTESDRIFSKELLDRY